MAYPTAKKHLSHVRDASSSSKFALVRRKMFKLCCKNPWSSWCERVISSLLFSNSLHLDWNTANKVHAFQRLRLRQPYRHVKWCTGRNRWSNHDACKWKRSSRTFQVWKYAVRPNPDSFFLQGWSIQHRSRYQYPTWTGEPSEGGGNPNQKGPGSWPLCGSDWKAISSSNRYILQVTGSVRPNCKGIFKARELPWFSRYSEANHWQECL